MAIWCIHIGNDRDETEGDEDKEFLALPEYLKGTS